MRAKAVRATGVAMVLALAALALVVTPAAAAAKTTITTVTATTPAYAGAPIVFTATVTHNTLVPTGSVTFAIADANSNAVSCDGGSNTVALMAATTGSSADCTIGAGLSAAASPYAVTATYTPQDTTFVGSVGTLAKVVHKAPTTTTVTSPTTPPVVTGEAVSFVAQVAPNTPSTGVPTGTVTFTVTGESGDMLTCDDTGGNTQPLTAGQAECDVPAATVAAADSPYTVTAVYSGDANDQTSTGTLTQDIFKAQATIALASSSPSVVTGEPVTFTATITGITPPGSGTPTGSVLFSVVGNSTPPTTATCNGGDTVPLTSSSAACTFAKGLPATPLNYTVTATLVDTSFKSPAPATLTLAVGKKPTTTTFSNLPGGIQASQSFTFTVTVKTTSPGTGSPNGYLEWAVCPDGATSCTPQNGTKGGTFLLPKPTAKDKAKNRNEVTISVPGGLAAGYYDVDAVYKGNSDAGSSTANPAHIPVSQISTTVELFGNHNPVANDGGVTIQTAVVPSSVSTGSLGAPSGSVTYTVTGNSGDSISCSNGIMNVVTISTTAQNQGIAKCTIPSGVLVSTDSPYRVKAVYSGDTNYATSKGVDTVTVEAPGGG
jgi:hypothetical protein